MLTLVLCVAVGQSQAQLQIVVDFDRNTPGVQADVTSPADTTIEGQISLIGHDPADTIGPGYGVAMSPDSAAIVAANTSATRGDAVGGGENSVINATNIFYTLVNFTVTTDADADFALALFDLQVTGADMDVIAFDFLPSTVSPSLGLGLNGATLNIFPDQVPAGAAGVPAIGGSVTIGTATGTPTETPTVTTPCRDSGYVILDSLGGRHNVGSPPNITGSLYYGRDVARDMEWATVVSDATKGAGSSPDLAVLDSFGAVQFVANPGSAPSQAFYFPEGSDPAGGYAVDVEVTGDSMGFRVLTEAGAIYGAGSALAGGADGSQPIDDSLVAALNIPFGAMRNPDLPDTAGDASIRAVGMVVVESADMAAPEGIVVIDSQGGHYLIGVTKDAADANSILNAATVYPFFAGLDIARDIELHPSGDDLSGVIIYDGWGGTHPVPVGAGASQVDFIRNEGPDATTVGLPYIQLGFDDPSTVENEGDAATYGIDSNSIFRDLEFCQAGSPGVYVLDAFGGVFAFGTTRAAADDPTPILAGGPYFFPALWAVDLEATTAGGQVMPATP